MSDALGIALYEQQKELNEIREALGLPIEVTHDLLIAILRELRDKVAF
jgi:hypothetical protein